MQTNSFVNADSIYTDHLIHNRLNLRVYPSDAVTIAVEARNRLFYGETIKLQQPYYGMQLDNDNTEFDLSWVWVNKNSLIAHTVMDRAYLNYSKGKLDATIGRQRINWGINLAWNPNDLFNAYNFADFDYSERPGTDAVRVQYYTGAMSSLDVAIKPSSDSSQWIGAAMYKFNKFNYDFQVLGGWYLEDIAIGGGWAGNIFKAGFKGEATYFHPQNFSDTSGVVNASITLDYAFEKGTYVNASVLYNSQGINTTSPTGMLAFSTTGSLSPKNLMPSKFTYFAQISGSFTPALGGSVSAMYLQGLNMIFAMPSFSYSINENWDVNLVGQIFFGERGNQFKNLGNLVFLRFQFSFSS